MHPVLARFDLFGQPVVFYAYGAMLLSALFAGIGIALNLAVRAGIDGLKFGTTLVWVALAAVAGARALGVATHMDAFSAGFPLSGLSIARMGPWKLRFSELSDRARARPLFAVLPLNS